MLIALSFAYVGLRFFPSGEFASVNVSFQKRWQVSSQQNLQNFNLREVPGSRSGFPMHQPRFFFLKYKTNI